MYFFLLVVYTGNAGRRHDVTADADGYAAAFVCSWRCSAHVRGCPVTVQITSGRPATIADCSWFQTLIRSGFHEVASGVVQLSCL